MSISARRRIAFAALLLAGALPVWAAVPEAGAGSQDMFRPFGPQAAHILDLWRMTLAISSAVFVWCAPWNVVRPSWRVILSSE